MDKKEEFFGVRPGVIIFFHFNNGMVSYLTWNTRGNGEYFPWHKKDNSNHKILPDIPIYNKIGCQGFMMLLIRMYGGASKINRLSISSIDPEKDSHGDGIIALQFG